MQEEKEERYNRQQANKKALVIAVSQYNSSSLKPIKFCENDGKEMYKVLKKLEYEIPDNCILIGNVESPRLKKAIYNFFTNQDNNPDDTLVFYYSGHGVPDKWGAAFLAPSDIDSDHPFLTGFSFADLTNSMLECNSLSVVTILDCCYSGSLELSKGLDSKSGEEAATRIANKIVEEKTDKLKQGVGRCLLASSQGYEEAYDRMEKDHSIFTYYLLEALKGHKNAVDNEGNVTYDSVGRFISREIGNLPRERRPNQTPIRKGQVSGGDIVLAHYTKQPVETKPIEKKSAADTAIIEALECIANEDYTNALSCLDKTLEIDPKNAKAYFYQGNTFAKLENYQEAVKSYQKALEIDPNPKYASAVSRLLEMVTRYIEKKEKGNEPEANDINKKIQKDVDITTKQAADDVQDPTLPSWYHSVYGGSRDKIDPTLPSSYHSVYGDSRDNIDKTKADKDPNPTLPSSYHSVYGDSRDNIDKTKADKDPNYQQAMENNNKLRIPPDGDDVHDPTLPSWYHSVYGRENISKAETVIESENEDKLDAGYDPTLPSWYHSVYGRENIDRGKTDSEYARQWNDEGNSLLSDGRYDEALICYDRALELNPNDAVTLGNKGAALLSLERYDEALEFFDISLELDPNSAWTWNERGVCLSWLGRYDEALICYDRALAIDPNYQPALDNKNR
jgi:tetratricopeptide (TPR) repeat protein